jgi:hypothetical protein
MEANTLRAAAEPRTAAVRALRWPLERVLFLMAGTVTLVSVILAAVVSEWFLALTAFVGLNQVAFVAFGDCPSSWLLRRYAGLERAIER